MRNKDKYFLEIATLVSTRGTCKRAQVGYIVVKDDRILATGYNGSLPGQPHCIDVGCIMDNGHCIATIHAEINCLVQGAKLGISFKDATMYGTWGPPCWNCFKAVAGTGINRIVSIDQTDEHHQNTLVTETAKDMGIELVAGELLS